MPSPWADIRAALLGPRLFDSDAPRPDLAWVDAHRDALLAHVAARPPSPRLGVRFERAFEAYFACHPGYRLLAANLPVREGGHTLGAADLLIEADGEVVHLELSVKFYAAAADASPQDLDAWLGPNAQDSLGRKFRRMKAHQLTLLQTEAGRQTLSKAGLPAPDRGIALMHGVLFLPHDAPPSLPMPDGLAGEAALGRWVPSALAASTLPAGAFLPREGWVSGTPVTPGEVASSVPYQWLAADGGRWLVLPDGHPACRAARFNP